MTTSAEEDVTAARNAADGRDEDCGRDAVPRRSLAEECWRTLCCGGRRAERRRPSDRCALWHGLCATVLMALATPSTTLRAAAALACMAGLNDLVPKPLTAVLEISRLLGLLFRCCLTWTCRRVAHALYRGRRRRLRRARSSGGAASTGVAAGAASSRSRSPRTDAVPGAGPNRRDEGRAPSSVRDGGRSPSSASDGGRPPSSVRDEGRSPSAGGSDQEDLGGVGSELTAAIVRGVRVLLRRVDGAVAATLNGSRRAGHGPARRRAATASRCRTTGSRRHR